MTETTKTPGSTGREGLRRLYGTLWHHAEGVRHHVVAFLVLLFLAQAVRLSIPWFFGQAANTLQTAGTQDVTAAAWAMAGMVGASVVGWALHGPGRVLERFTAVRLRERMADALYAKAVSLPLRWHEIHHSGETIQRMQTATGALFGFAQHQFVYLQNLVSVVGPMVALFFVSTPVALAAMAGYAVIGIILVRFDGMMLRLVRQENAAAARYHAELIDCLGNISTVVTLRLQEATRRTVAARYAAISEPLRGTVLVNEAKWGAIDLLNVGLKAGVVGLYAWLAWRQNGVILVGSAVMVHQYADQVGSVVNSMAGHWGDLMRHKADIANADDILEAEARSGAGVELPIDWRGIQVEGLTFHHASRRSG
ncbi:MAG TPA: ABC transporter transmembrane domain-containing protein, partial [Azospirillaceae bacterium]|nr:ABC transporter transmembrane domain-containing protein [Azospirillaceae bacterium]